MHIHEFGNKDNPVILLLPGTMCYWKGNFGNVIDELAKDFFVAVVAYTGFDEEDKEDYQSVSDNASHRGICVTELWRTYTGGIWLFTRRYVRGTPCFTRKDTDRFRHHRKFRLGSSG